MSVCPKCGASLVMYDFGGNPWYACGSHKTFRSAPCVDREPVATQLRAAQDRIKQLEAVTNDPHALWANWLRGDVKLPEGIGDVRQYQDRIKRLEEFARTIEKDFDHDEDAHRYGTTCRVCDAEDLLKETKAKEAKP